MMKLSAALKLRMQAKQRAQLQRLADEKGVSLATVMRWALQELINNNKPHRAPRPMAGGRA